jgi:hypothetical protein
MEGNYIHILVNQDGVITFSLLYQSRIGSLHSYHCKTCPIPLRHYVCRSHMVGTIRQDPPDPSYTDIVYLFQGVFSINNYRGKIDQFLILWLLYHRYMFGIYMAGEESIQILFMAIRGAG